MAVGYAKDAADIGDVRKFIEYISYPGNPSFTRQAEENAAGDSDKAETDTSAQQSGEDSNSSDTEENNSSNSEDNSDDLAIISTAPMVLADSNGNTITVKYILYEDNSYEYRGDD